MWNSVLLTVKQITSFLQWLFYHKIWIGALCISEYYSLRLFIYISVTFFYVQKVCARTCGSLWVKGNHGGVPAHWHGHWRMCSCSSSHSCSSACPWPRGAPNGLIVVSFFTEPFCLANYPSAFHSVMFNPVEPRLLATANSKEGVGLWDIRKPQRWASLFIRC